MPDANAPAASRAKIKSTRVSPPQVRRLTRHSLRNGLNDLFRALPGEPGFLATIVSAMRKHCRQLDASVGTSVARFPKFVRNPRPHFHELRKASGNSNFDSSAAYDFEVPKRNRGELLRNFKIGGTGTTRLRRPLVSRTPCEETSVHRLLPRVRGDREPPLN